MGYPIINLDDIEPAGTFIRFDPETARRPLGSSTWSAVNEFRLERDGEVFRVTH